MTGIHTNQVQMPGELINLVCCIGGIGGVLGSRLHAALTLGESIFPLLLDGRWCFLG